MPKKRLPSIFVDEHVNPAVTEAFRVEGFRTVEIARDSRYAGRDEKDFVKQMYASNEVLVTGDNEFAEYAVENRVRHAGIVFIPQQMTTEEKALFAEIAAGFIRGAVDSGGEFAIRGTVIYPAYDGLRQIEKDRSNSLVISWDRLFQTLD